MKTFKLPATLLLLLTYGTLQFVPTSVAQEDDLRSVIRGRGSLKRASQQSNNGRRPHPALLSRKDQLAIVSSLAQQAHRHEQKATLRPGLNKPGIEDDEDLYLPDQDIGVAHLVDVRVNCGKNVMDVTMTFDNPFSGMIYSKGHHSDPRCRYGDPSIADSISGAGSTVRNETLESTVLPDTSKLSRRFSLQAGRCGSRIVEGGSGEAYFENTVIVQHTPGIQSAIDTARALRCAFEAGPGSGSVVSRTVSSSLAVDVLDVISVTYSGDSIDSYLDVQLGKGPFHANPVNGLVKIGETLTLVVYIHGDGYDVHVKDCVAHDGDAAANSIRLSDDRGCVLTPKLMGPWQKTRDTANTGASAIAWAYLEAFKFPDKLEVFIECNIEICKYECPHDEETCLAAKKASLRRRRARVSNATLADDAVLTRLRREKTDQLDEAQSQTRPTNGDNELSETAHLMRGIRVIAPEDAAEESANHLTTPSLGVHSVSVTGSDRPGSVVLMNSNQLCVSTTGFLFVAGLSVAVLVALLLTIVGLYLRMRQLDPDVQLVNEAAMAGSMQRRHVIASISDRAGKGAPRRKGDF